MTDSTDMSAYLHGLAVEAEERAEAEERGEVEPMPAFRPRTVSAKDAHEAHLRDDGGWAAAVTSTEIRRRDVLVGQATVLVCVSCLYSTATCDHTINTWNAEGTVLSCALCGRHGT